ncbi:TIGR03826 family flagellar region protein [Virgibacillus alimentarius]|uniref:Flagellar operon protein (TIGR03826 family) n=1 Tax=Virgibacillus alimentarius TaxID=698769 RepID=A0ABS4S5L3_9BACI|nr:MULTISPECIES: TIGR03826 family flagellar region protein [Virgibacillus]MBP2256788.1 flagellar operon protein (TIGR03826 family) [Virgibacillus alimentarius]HLR65657.1 TIGR03826 family flagellar region protein [Virgibacillus sp.]
MTEIANCSRCDSVYVKNIRDICRKCYEEEEKAFETVYRFLIKRKNREATISEIAAVTDVDELLIIKFMKEGRLSTSKFSKLAYPCKKCGVPINSGRLCGRCSETLLEELEQHEKAKKEKTTNKKIRVYYTLDKNNE